MYCQIYGLLSSTVEGSSGEPFTVLESKPYMWQFISIHSFYILLLLTGLVLVTVRRAVNNKYYFIPTRWLNVFADNKVINHEFFR